MTKKKAKKVSERDQCHARDKWDLAHQSIDDLWGKLQEVSGLDLQDERDAVLNALDLLLELAACRRSPDKLRWIALSRNGAPCSHQPSASLRATGD